MVFSIFPEHDMLQNLHNYPKIIKVSSNYADMTNSETIGKERKKHGHERITSKVFNVDRPKKQC